MNTDMVQPDV